MVSLVLKQKQLANSLEESTRNSLRKFEGDLIPSFEAPLSVYSQVTHIINTFHTENSYHRYLEHERWPALEAILADALAELPPIYLFIDAVDEEYAHAPMYWLQCQKGLFYRTMRLLRDAKLGGRLHVVACLRDHVFASVLQSEHATRYKDEPHIKSLRWDRRAIRFLLEAKVRRLPAELLAIPDSSSRDVLESWLGFSSIKNVDRGIHEPVADYLLRHTRLLPRDIVILGNAICLELQQTTSVPRQEVIRAVIADNGRAFGREQLAIAANHVASDLMPRSAGRLDFTDYYTRHDAYRNQVYEKIAAVIRKIGRDRFAYDELCRAREESIREFEGQSDVFSVLWHCGLIGRRDASGNGKDIFFNEAAGDFALPMQAAEYCFHSCLIDAVGIEPTFGQPPVYAA